MESQKIAIGVDVGGTSIRSGVVSRDGSFMGEPFLIPTNANESKERIVERIIDSIAHVKRLNNLKNKDIRGIGMGVTGPLDVKNGRILECPSLPTMDFFPLRDTIEKEFKLPVFMNNDANAMMLGESFWGAGKGFNCVLGITIGTGLGCAIVINKKIWMGVTETAGEIWMSPYKDGNIEDIVSGRGVSALYQKLKGSFLTAKEIAKLAYEGDQAAKTVWNEFGNAVAFALSWSINLLDPDVVIIGGSMANSMELFSESLNSALRKSICPVPAQNLRIVKAQMGDSAGIAGAASLAF